jgi:hypothetical protein
MKSLLTALSLAIACTAAAVTVDNENLWLNYVGDHPLGSGPWGLHLEAQMRLSEYGDDWQQYLLRPGVNYQISPHLMATVGYAYVKTYPYGELPSLDSFPEDRIWEQLAYTHTWAGIDWTHRLRLEQRYIGELSPDGRGGYDVDNYRYENRIRYMLRAQVPLSSDKKWYAAIWDEVFFNFGSNVVGNDFDQNRAFIGIGRKVSDSTKIELGFLEQTLLKRGGENWENNHTIALWVLSKWPFGK